ncbi:SDR family oxidoreductase [Kitasatospora indigofera]|uniref:SDR family oxidoreductase n=1 Tax=Kitasatospora indigofera TaxID=67307 RepID=UPI003679F0BF
MSPDLSTHVIVVTGSRRPEDEAVVRRLTAAGALVVQAGDDQPVRELFAGVVERYGRVDALVNVTDAPSPAGRTEALGAAALPALAAAPGGVIVDVVVHRPGAHRPPAGDADAGGTPWAGAAAHGVPVVRLSSDGAPADGVAELVGLLAAAGPPALHGLTLDVTAEAAAPAPPVPDGTAPAGADAPQAGVDEDAIVVVGMGLAVPGASSPEAFWELLRGGEAVFGEPGDRLDLDTVWSADPAAEDRTYARVSGFMHGFDPHPRLKAELAAGTFDAEEYTALWLRHSLLQATDGVTVRPGDRRLFAVGLTPDGSHHLEQSLVTAGVRELLTRAGAPVPAALDALYPLGSAAPESVLPYRIARTAVADLPETTEIVVVDTACSSSLYTIDLGVRALRAGEADVALCGGAFALSAQNVVLFSKLRGLSRSGRVRALDQAADGVLFSDGAAVLTLKTHARAVADGDTVLGFVAGFGASSDGRGKAIYAPNPAGQRVALERAWSSAGAVPADVDWIVAHATGTPTGDRTEMTALSELAGEGGSWTMTSNKSLVGHSGWAAGAVSAVHALLGLRHRTIPAQQQFDALPAGTADAIGIPVADVAWEPSPDRRRLVGVSAMGFGGTNGHLLLADRPAGPKPAGLPDPSARPSGPGRPAATAPEPDPVVVVAQGLHLPGAPDEEQVARWLAGGEPQWPATFGDAYPTPTPVEARLAPAALAAVDRSQLMAMRCADLLAGDWVKDGELAARTGVLVGHTGPTGSAVGYNLRCYLNDLTEKLTGPAGLPPELLTDPIRAMVRPTNEDSYPGLMPNIIAARVAQRLDLHGPNMTLDAGRDSVNSALATAVRYLRDGEVDLALVIGVNAGAPFLGGADDRPPAEGAVGFLLTRQSVARAHDLPVLGRIAIAAASTAASTAMSTAVSTAASAAMSTTGTTADAPGPAPDTRGYRGADGAVALLRALHSGGEQVLLRPVEDGHTPALLVFPGRGAGEAAGEAGPAGVTATSGDGTGLESVLSRHALTLRPVEGVPVRGALAALPAGALILTDDPPGLAALAARSGTAIPPDCLIVAPGSAPRDPDARIAVRYLDDPAALAGLLGPDGRRFDQVRVLVGSRRADGPGQLVPQPVLDLNDLAFVAAQACAERLDAGGCYAVLMLDAYDDTVPLPYVGVFGGLLRSLAQELTGGQVYGLATAGTDLATGLAELAEESAMRRFVPLVHRPAGQRLELMLLPVPATPADAGPRLPEDPVVVATGGARGLTAHLVGEVVAGCRPRAVWLLGTSAAGSDGPDDVAALPRAEALRVLMARYPGEKPVSLSRRYDRALQRAERDATLRSLEEQCGPGRVHYRQCDVLDEGAVRKVMDEILAAEGRVDVLLHGAGLARSAVLARKKLADFRTVRDVKVRGYANLRAALTGHPTALWCSVSSVSAFTGLRGEHDYGAGNEFLLLAAAHARAVEGRDEVALVSGLWVESGMASADTPSGAFLASQGEIGQLTDQQGREFFRRELAGRGSHGLATTWIGDADWSTLQRLAPDFRAACLETAEAAPEPLLTVPPRRGPQAFLTAPPEQRGEESVWRIELGLDEHPYLLDHLVDGRPTVPGTFILEMAAEAAAGLAPGLLPVRITDVVLSQFIRAARHRWPRQLEVAAVRTGDRVRVRITSPAAGPVPEREHTRMVVHLASALPPAPRYAVGAGTGPAAPDTYRLPGTTVELGGVFEALCEPRLAADGGSALLRLAVPAGAGPFDRFVLPSVALDCLLRTSVLDGRRAHEVDVMVPTRLASVEFFTAANDIELAAAGEAVTLRHWHDTSSGEGRCAALTHDGRALIRVRGITGATKGTYDTRTGAWRPAGPTPVRTGSGH